ncbi:MAG: ABC transporter substrate-binding protein [Phycisphaerales bacterium]|nr:ABC transporter substrate-binding protein [Phycisphaerales bacterium]
MRIVSLLPSATEIVCAIGLTDQLVAVSAECDHPAAVRDKPRVTGARVRSEASGSEIDAQVRDQLATGQSLYTLDADLLRSLAPDLIITQTLCRVCAVSGDDVRQVAANFAHPPRVLVLEPTTLGDVLESIRTIGEAADAEVRGRALAAALEARMERVRERTLAAGRYPCGTARPAATRRVAVLEWLDPPFSSGHWTPELVALAGGVEPLAKAGERSRRVELSELVAADPDDLVIACCGFDALRTLREVPAFLAQPPVAGLRSVREGRVFVFDGNAYFSRPGPRLIDALEMLAHTLNGRAHPAPAGVIPPIRVT